MNTKCDRCGEPLEGKLAGCSWFNTDFCCSDCLEKERNHPKYQEAKEAERQAVLSGNYNFEGIGKPSDL